LYGKHTKDVGDLCGLICHVEISATISDLNCKQTDISNMLSYRVWNKDQW